MENHRVTDIDKGAHDREGARGSGQGGDGPSRNTARQVHGTR